MTRTEQNLKAFIESRIVDKKLYKLSDWISSGYHEQAQKLKELYPSVKSFKSKINVCLRGGNKALIKCPVCGAKLTSLHTHLDTHANGLSELLKVYHSYPMLSPEYNKQLSNGSFSPYSKNFINEPLEAHRRPTRIEYYIARGLSKEDAEQALKERQATFTKDKCIAKHGVKKGTEIWEKRQQVWQETILSKPPEEIKRINASKAPKLNNSAIWKSDGGHKDASLYFVELNGFLKVGFTTRTISQRYSHSSDSVTDVFYEYRFDNAHDAFAIEQIILRKFPQHRIDIGALTEVFNGYTECFKIEHSKEIIGYAKRLIKYTSIETRRARLQTFRRNR